MLFREGKDDVAGYAIARPARHEPGAVWNYSSGTSNIVAALAGRAAGGPEPMRRLLVDDLFGPAGMTSAIPKFDAAGTFVGSSFVYATARDFARFGHLYLDDGRDLLPPGWVDHARRITPGSDGEYGAHWWLRPGDTRGAFYASGYEGQRTVVVPAKELVVVRLGKTPIELAPNLWPLIDGIIAAV
jgi:CubicO group peptidase (beta-lactamase class C family)